MTGEQWDKLQAWQRAAPGRRVMVELDSRLPLFPPYDPLSIQTIIVTAYRDGVASVPLKPEEFDRIDDRLREAAVEAARAAVENGARLLDRLGAGR